jgi:hypothetical protein
VLDVARRTAHASMSSCARPTEVSSAKPTNPGIGINVHAKHYCP